MESPELTGHVSGDCLEALETLIEHGGDPAAAGPGVRRHLEQCAACEDTATEEQALGDLLRRASGLDAAADLGDQMAQEILQSLPRRSLRWRLLTAAPVGTSVLLAGIGVLLVGGAPGTGLMHLLPAWSSRGWMAVLHSARDWAVAFDTIARNSELLIPIAFSVTAALLAGAGMTGLAATTLRLRKSAAWSRRA